MMQANKPAHDLDKQALTADELVNEYLSVYLASFHLVDKHA